MKHSMYGGDSEEMEYEQAGGVVVTGDELEEEQLGGGSKKRKTKVKKSKSKGKGKSKKKSMKKRKKYRGGFSAKNAAVATLLAGKYLLSKKSKKSGKSKKGKKKF